MKFTWILPLLLSFGVLFADTVIAINELPKNAQEFIFKNFAHAQIVLAKKDRNSYDVILNDGTEIEFISNGEWKDIDGKYKALPNSILPDIMPNISALFNAQIVELSKKNRGYKFELDNKMKIYTDRQGNILRQKSD